jgi:hypothetical protein
MSFLNCPSCQKIASLTYHLKMLIKSQFKNILVNLRRPKITQALKKCQKKLFITIRKQPTFQCCNKIICSQSNFMNNLSMLSNSFPQVVRTRMTRMNIRLR